MTVVDVVISAARDMLSDDGLRELSRQALWLAGESQKPTALPALTLVASTSLLVVMLWLAAVATAIRWIRTRRRA